MGKAQPCNSPGQIFWKPGFFRRAPWSAIFALFLSIICALISATIIVISHEHVATWRWQPSVILGFLASFATAMIVVAFVTGVNITWWRAALQKRGASLDTLHRIWNYGGGGGQSAAWFAGTHVNKVAIASVLVAAAGLSYSPLLQRSSHIESFLLWENNIDRKISVIQQFEGDYLGTSSGGNSTASYTFTETVQDWSFGYYPQTVPALPYYCNDTCTGWVRSPGISHNLTSRTFLEIDLESATADGEIVTGFQTRFARMDNDSVPTLAMEVVYIKNVSSQCVATRVTELYMIQAGHVKYPVRITNTSVGTDDYRVVGGVVDFTPFSYPGDSPTNLQATSSGPLSALKWTGNLYFAANSSIYRDSEGDYGQRPVGRLALQWYDYTYTDHQCSFRWVNPAQSILRAFDEILFFAAIDAANGTAANELYIEDASLQTTTSVYISSYLYLIIASAILLLAIVAVSLTLYGWWELGRRVSLSPLETARAFGAHLWQLGTSADPKALAGNTKGRKFRYGVLRVVQGDGVEREVLGFAEVGVGDDPVGPEERRYI